MRITSVEIKGIKGIEHLAIQDIGALTLLQGPNGAGKSSGLDALEALFCGGKTEGLLRLGMTKGSMVATFDTGHVAELKVGKGKGFRFTDAEGIEIRKGRDELKKLFDALAFNPIGFVVGKPKDRVNQLFATCAADLDSAEVIRIFKPTGQSLPAPNGSPLEWLDRCRQLLFETRTGTNRSLRDAEGIVTDLASSVSAVDEAEDWPARSEADWAKVEEAKAAREAAQAGARKAYDAVLLGLREQHDQIVGELTTVARESAAKRDLVNQLQGAREQYEKAKVRVSDLDVEASSLTAALKQIDELKQELLTQIPIEGLEVLDGDLALARDGGHVSWEDLSESERILIALKLTEARCGEIRVVRLDGCERLDEDSIGALRAHCKKLKLQAFGGLVKKQPKMTVEQS